MGISEIIGTKSIGSVTSKDEVSLEEEKVFSEIIQAAGIKLVIYDTLEEAINHTLKETGENDIVFLAGCQGMDKGAKIALEYISSLRPDLNLEDLYKPLKTRANN